MQGVILNFFFINIIGKLYKEENFRIRPVESMDFIYCCNIFSLLLLNGKKGPFGGILLMINLIYNRRVFNRGI